MQHTAPVQGLHHRHQAPGLATEGTGIHRQRATQGAGDAGQELRPGEPGPRRRPRHLGTGDPGTGMETVVPHPAQLVECAKGEHHRAADAAVAHQQVAAQAQPQQRFFRRQAGQEAGQVIQVRRLVETIRGTTHPPAGMGGHGLPLSQFTAQGWL